MSTTLKYLKPYRSTVIWGLILKFFGAVAELMLPLFLEYVINDVEAMAGGGTRRIAIVGVCMFGCSIVALLGNIFANRLTVKSSGNMTHDLRYDLFTKITLLTSPQVDKIGIPTLISRLTSDSYYVNQMVARTLRLGVRAPILILGGLVLAFWRSPMLACVLLACVPLVGITIFLITKRSVPVFFSVQRKQDDMVRSCQENVTGVRVIKALDKGDFESKKFDSLASELADKEFKANKIMSLSNPLATLILNLGLVAVIVVGAYIGAKSGTVLAFLQYFVIILNAMIALSKIFVMISRGMASSARIRDVLELNTDETVTECAKGKDCKLCFDDVSFSYNGEEDNIKHISFELYEGQTLGIIGGTGSGKSTIVNLLLRFYDPGSGNIYLSGRNLRSMTRKEIGSVFGVAFQNDFLMSGSIRSNVDYGRGLNDEALYAALKSAQAEFVDELGGLDYMLTRLGGNLSGGQKQRLILARALAAHPSVLVLDDSSSALDYATDAAFRRSLKSDFPDVTKVIVAQRISSVKNADLIIVLDDGEMIGKGTHDELLASCEEYALIYKAQMGGENG